MSCAILAQGCTCSVFVGVSLLICLCTVLFTNLVSLSLSTQRPSKTVVEAMPELQYLSSTWLFARVVAVVSFTTSLLAVKSDMLTFLTTCSKDQWNLGDRQNVVLVICVVLGFILGTFVLGPLADIWGRISVIQWCMAAFVLFGVASAFSPSFPVFVILRTCTSFKGALGRLFGRTLERDGRLSARHFISSSKCPGVMSNFDLLVYSTGLVRCSHRTPPQ